MADGVTSTSSADATRQEFKRTLTREPAGRDMESVGAAGIVKAMLRFWIHVDGDIGLRLVKQIDALLRHNGMTS